MTSPDHIVLGADYPAAGPTVIDSALAALSETPLLADQELSAVATNALHLPLTEGQNPERLSRRR
jgi:hypothetical protein